MHEQQLETDGGHEVLDEGRMAADEVLIVQQGARKLPEHDVREAEELAAGIEKPGHGAAERMSHVEERARLHVEHVLHLSVGCAVQYSDAAFSRK